MRKQDTILDEIHETRKKIDKQTKNMTTTERTEYFNRRGEAIAEKYGFKIVVNVKNKTIKQSF